MRVTAKTRTGIGHYQTYFQMLKLDYYLGLAISRELDSRHQRQKVETGLLFGTCAKNSQDLQDVKDKVRSQRPTQLLLK